MSRVNMFADLDVPDHELALLKANISIAIEPAIERKGISKHEAGELMGVPAVKVSNIIYEHLRGHTLERYLASCGGLMWMCE